MHYAALGIPEYWRFDETGNYHGVRLAGDRLVNGQYQPIDIVKAKRFRICRTRRNRTRTTRLGNCSER